MRKKKDYMKMKIKKKQMKERIWVVIKLRFLSTKKLQEKKIRKKKYIYFYKNSINIVAT